MIDVHAHYLSPALLADATGPGSPVGYDSQARILSFPSGPSRPIPPPLTDLESRRRWNQERSIELQVVSPWMDVTGEDLDASDAVQWCRMYNDAVAEDIAGSDGLKAMAALPLSSGTAAADELARSIGELGFVGGALPTQVEGADLDTAGLDPLFSTAEEAGVPLFVHPHKVMARERMGEHFLFNVCGNPFETTLAAMRLFFSGVFDRWPGLKLVLAHAGGALPVLAGRAWHASNHASGFDRGLGAPSEILDCFYYDTILHDPAALAHAVEAAGPSRVMAGTDFPFPMLLDDPVGHVEAACVRAGMGDGDVDRILRSNAEALFGL